MSKEKENLIGKEVIICDGDFKGVRGKLHGMHIETDNLSVRSSMGGLMTFESLKKIICYVYINERNTIIVLLNDIIKVEQ